MQPEDDREIKELIELLESMIPPASRPGQENKQGRSAPNEQEADGFWVPMPLAGATIGTIIGMALAIGLLLRLFGG